MTTINWKIIGLDCAPIEDGETNVVKVVHWSCDGADDDYSGRVYSSCALPAPEGQFVAYDSLTPETILGWIWANGVDQEATEAAVQAQIDAARTPPIVKPLLPWAA